MIRTGRVFKRWLEQLGPVLMLLGGLTLGAASHAQSTSPPSISGTPPASVAVGSTYSFTPTVTVPSGQSYTLSISNLPRWATFDATNGRLVGRPTSSNIGVYPDIRIVLKSGQHFVLLPPFTITVVGANAPPTISGTPAGSVTVGSSYSFRPTARDANGDALTFSITNRPAWARFDSGTGRLSGTPGSTNIGTYSNIVISVCDGRNRAALPAFTITVVGANAPPTISGTPAGSVTAGNSYSFRPAAGDPEGATLTFSIVNKPAWAVFTTSTGRLYGTPGSSRVGSYSNIRISVSDGQSTVSLPAFSITVSEAPATGSATVSWSPPATNVDGTPLTNLAGYRVVYGQSSSDLSNSLEIPGPRITSAVIEALTPSTWYFAVKAYTTAGIESDLSNVVFKIIN